MTEMETIFFFAVKNLVVDAINLKTFHKRFQGLYTILEFQILSQCFSIHSEYHLTTFVQSVAALKQEKPIGGHTNNKRTTLMLLLHSSTRWMTLLAVALAYVPFNLCNFMFCPASLQCKSSRTRIRKVLPACVHM